MRRLDVVLAALPVAAAFSIPDSLNAQSPAACDRACLEDVMTSYLGSHV